MIAAHQNLSQTQPGQHTPREGFAPGTRIATLAGITPVERLRRGDRVVTRSGAQRLAKISKSEGRVCLQFHRPQVVYLFDRTTQSESQLAYIA